MEDQLKAAQEKKKQIEDQHRKKQRTKQKLAILQIYVDNIQKERVLKRSTFWQNWLNMMMYTVFVLNALIAGFGLANPTTAPVAVNANVPNVTMVNG